MNGEEKTLILSSNDAEKIIFHFTISFENDFFPYFVNGFRDYSYFAWFRYFNFIFLILIM